MVLLKALFCNDVAQSMTQLMTARYHGVWFQRHRQRSAPYLIHLWFQQHKRRKQLNAQATELRRGVSPHWHDERGGLFQLARVHGMQDLMLMGFRFLTYGYHGKLLRVVLAVASRLPYDTPMPQLVAACDRLSGGKLLEQAHLVRRRRPCGWSLHAARRTYKQGTPGVKVGAKPLAIHHKAPGLKWLKKQTNIYPRWTGIRHGTKSHPMDHMRKVHALLQYL